MRVEIEDTTVSERSGNKNGRDWKIRTQNALLWRAGENYPDKFKVTLNGDTPAMPKGEYALHDDSFVIDTNGSLSLSRFEMQFVMVDSKGKAVSS